MKIDFTIPKPIILPEGTHRVKISGITIGTHLRTGNKFFKCVFSNKTGYLPQWFYITESSKPFLKHLFTACGIHEEIAEVKALLNKEVIIDVIMKDLVNPQTGEVTKTISSCKGFKPISDLKLHNYA